MMPNLRHIAYLTAMLAALSCAKPARMTVSPKDDGYRGLWNADMASTDEYRYIYYSGGLGTSTAKHIPMAYYAKAIDRTFFCWGGASRDTNRLRLMVSYYDHTSGTVPRPTIIMEKDTEDHHDNPTLMLDSEGYVWVFVSAHGQVRHAYIYRSTRPYDIDRFDLVKETNFSYPQPWFIEGEGFLFLQTLYIDGRNLYWSTSRDGVTWTAPEKLAAIGEGHYQVSWRRGSTVGTAFNFHPSSKEGGNWNDPEKPGVAPAASGTNNRTNLYYIQTSDFGETWRTIRGETVSTPLTEEMNPALVRDYRSEGLLVYVKDIAFDTKGNPVILFLTSKGSESGPKNDPRTWTTARWTGAEWIIRPVTVSDNNYDTGALFIEDDGLWRIIGPTERGPQSYNCGGEIAVWTSRDEVATWVKETDVTQNSEYNHSYARKAVNGHPGFAVFWADGNGREKSSSRLYFCDRTGRNAFMLPETMEGDTAHPISLNREETK